MMFLSLPDLVPSMQRVSASINSSIYLIKRETSAIARDRGRIRIMSRYRQSGNGTSTCIVGVYGIDGTDEIEIDKRSIETRVQQGVMKNMMGYR